MGPWLQPSHGGIPGSCAHKGSFLPVPQHSRIRPKHSISFCTRWPCSSLARCQLPDRNVSPPQCSTGSRSPLPNTGGLCGAAGLNGGSVWLGMLGGGKLTACFICLPGSGDQGQARLPQRRHFHASANGMGSAVLHPSREACSMPTMGTQQGLGSASLPPCACTVLNPPACCSWRARAWGGMRG